MRAALGLVITLAFATTAHADPASQPTADPSSQPAVAPTTPEPPAVPEAPAPARKKLKVEWGYKGGFFAKTADGNFKIKLGGWAHVTYLANITDTDLSKHAIDLRMARLVFKASAFKYLHSRVVLELMNELPVLYYDATFQPFAAFGVRFGQFKAPIVRHFLMAPFKRTFVSSALAMTKFKHDWDMGASVLGSFKDHLIEYEAGVWNGSGRNKANDNTDLMGAARVVVNPFGKVGLIESDYQGFKKPKLSIGAAVLYNPFTNTSTDATGTAVTTDSKQVKMSTDAAFFYRGLAVIAEVYYRSTWTGDKDAINGLGWLAQAAYFFLPQRLEGGLRGGMIRLNMDKDDADQYEISTVVNYYVYKTMFKVQGEYTMRLAKVPGKDDVYNHAVRIQGLFRF